MSRLSLATTPAEIAAPPSAQQPDAGPSARPRFSNRRAYAQTITATVLIRGLGVVSGVLAARLLGPAGRGELAVIIFLPMLLLPVGEIELPRSMAFETSRTPVPDPKVVSTGFWAALALGCIQALVLLLALRTFLPSDKLYLLPAAKWFAIYLPAVYVTVSLTGVDQGRGRFGRFSVFQVMPTAAYVLGVLFLWYAHLASPQSFAMAILAGALLALAVRLALDWRPILHAAPDWTTAKRLLGRGLAFYLPAVAGYILLRSDMLLAVRMMPTAAIGLYAVAQAIAFGQIGAVLPFVQVGFSAVAGEADHAKALETMAHHFRLAQLMVVPVGAVAAILTPWAIPILFGSKFSAATAPALLLIGAMMFWGAAQVLDHGLRAASHPRAGIFSNILGIAVLLALGVPSCRLYGTEGLAAAVLLAQIANMCVLLAFCTTRLRVPGRLLCALATQHRGAGASAASQAAQT